MARFEFKLPDIGEGVAEGEIVAWHVQSGDQVKEDQAMVEVMTDKATVTIGAPKKGAILETHAAVGQVLSVGALLVVIETEGDDSKAMARPSAPPPPSMPAPTKANIPAPKASDGPAATAVGDIKDTLPGTGFFAPTSPAKANGTNGHAAQVAERPLATPATRKLARELDIDLRFVSGTGPGGRITSEDVKAHTGRTSTAAAPSSTTKAAASGVSHGRAPMSIPHHELDERKPFVGMRRKIAERMQMSKTTAAHFTFVEECDVARLKELRQRLRPSAEKAGIKLTYLPFITKAVVSALKRFPVLNSALDETTNELVYRNHYHLGIATSTDQGLMVPVVKDADRRSILDIAREIDRLGNAAKNGTIQSSELTGSTFTITSLGTQGGLFATPVLNFPEVGILGVHQIKQKPVVRDGHIVIGEIMLLSLSFDHRIVDGHVGAAFAYDIISYLEDPDRLFLEMT